MNERSIQLALYRHFRSSWACACPNFTPGPWWECDLWAVTKAGYEIEYEIKTSMPDFRCDAKKAQDGTFLRSAQGEVERDGRGRLLRQTTYKHDQLVAGAGPSRFYYVVPESLVEPVRPCLPAWAGLVACVPWGRGRARVRSIVVQAPQLHRRKVDRRRLEQAKKTMWYRYWDALANGADVQVEAGT